MMNNNQKFWLNIGYKQGCKEAGFYWTGVMTIALHNLYGWKNFDKLENEVERLHEEFNKYREDKLVGDKFIQAIEDIRGKDYFERRV